MRRVPEAFDARFSALSRRYVYRVSDAAYGALPLRRHDTVGHPRPLVAAPAADARRSRCSALHDFAAFCRRREGATTVRTLRRLTWTRDRDGVLNATVEADAFCHQMVRCAGRRTPAGRRRPAAESDWPAEVLRARRPDARRGRWPRRTG